MTTIGRAEGGHHRARAEGGGERGRGDEGEALGRRATNRLGPPPRPVAGPGDEDSKAQAFLQRFLQAERRIFAYILTLLPYRADAEDVLQESSLLMWEKFDERSPPGDFVAWGCRIAYFRVQQHRRGAGRRRRLLFSEAMLERVAETASSESSALRLDDRDEALAHCLGMLGRRDRELLEERYREGATTRSAADRLGRSAEAVYKALAKVRRALLDCIERRLDAGGRS